MGFNSTVVICNDAFSAIDDDPAGWWARTKTAISHAHMGHKPVEYGFGHHANGFWAVSNHHADQVSLIAVGGNYPTVLFQEHWGNRGHHSDEDKLELLRRAAGQLGYTLTKKPVGRVRPRCRDCGRIAARSCTPDCKCNTQARDVGHPELACTPCVAAWDGEKKA
jgi:hypothetical protein